MSMIVKRRILHPPCLLLCLSYVSISSEILLHFFLPWPVSWVNVQSSTSLCMLFHVSEFIFCMIFRRVEFLIVHFAVVMFSLGCNWTRCWVLLDWCPTLSKLQIHTLIWVMQANDDYRKIMFWIILKTHESQFASEWQLKTWSYSLGCSNSFLEEFQK